MICPAVNPPSLLTRNETPKEEEEVETEGDLGKEEETGLNLHQDLDSLALTVHSVDVGTAVRATRVADVNALNSVH